MPNIRIEHNTRVINSKHSKQFKDDLKNKNNNNIGLTRYISAVEQICRVIDKHENRISAGEVIHPGYAIFL